LGVTEKQFSLEAFLDTLGEEIINGVEGSFYRF
jgi:hypothetical protein